MLRLGEPPDLVVAGRTDAGVHARGQVVHVDVAADAFATLPGRSRSTPPESLVTRLAGVLPHDVVVRQVRIVPDAFDARFGAVERRYRYRVGDAAHRPDPLHRGHVLWVREPLDPAAMHRAGQPLLGEHDFVAFCRPRPGATTVRRLHQLTVSRDEVGLVVVEVAADAFCHHQVRALTGALLAVGTGRREESWPAQVLAAGRRDGAVHVAPAHGLTLEHVQYPPHDRLADQAARTRTLRGAPR